VTTSSGSTRRRPGQIRLVADEAIQETPDQPLSMFQMPDDPFNRPSPPKMRP
jgi:hypothetical protein